MVANRWHIRLPTLATILVVVLAGALVRPAPAYAFTYSKNDPVILVHGYSVGTECPGHDVNDYWRPVIDNLRGHGWREFHPVGYYRCDHASDWIDNDGSHNHWFATDHGAAKDDGHRSHGRDTDIAHLGYHLAWYIYNHWSKNGRNVQVVAHSMGGLLVRHALQKTQDHNPEFPPYLRVHDVVTLGTPHTGSNLADDLSLQTKQMQPESSFLRDLHKNGAPRGADDTVWTVIGSQFDLLVHADSATAMCCTNVRKVSYVNPHVGHNDYTNPDNARWDWDADICFRYPNGRSQFMYADNAPRVASLTERMLNGGSMLGQGWNERNSGACGGLPND